MDLVELFSMNEEARYKECQCDVCQKWVSEFDIVFIEDLQVCTDSECSDLTYLRLEGYVKSASERTNQLV